MADDRTLFFLDVDNTEFLAKMLESQGAVKNLGGAENLEGLLTGLMSAGAAIGALGVAAFAVKEAFDLVFNAEQIMAVNEQFTLLAKNAGVSADTLKAGLIEAGGGLATDTELLQAANKALAEMGVTAKQLPQTLALARQVTAVFGGNLISNFEGINQAIASGNVRMLKHMGIIIDQKKAYDDFARSIGTSSDMLSTQGKQQAMMNAVLAAGDKAFKGVNVNVKEATNLWQTFKTTMSELGEAVSVIFNTVFGKTVVSMLGAASQAAKVFLGLTKQIFGTEQEKSEIKYKNLQGEYANRQKLMLSLEDKRRKESQISEDLIQTAYNKTKAQHLASIDETIAQEHKKLDELKSKMDSIKPEGDRGPASTDEAGAAAATNNAIFIDQQKSLDKQKEAHKQFEDDLETLREERLSRETANTMTSEEVEHNHLIHLEAINNEYNEKLKALKTEEKEAGITKTAEAAEAEREIEAQKNAAIKAMNDKLQSDKIAAMGREKAAATSTAAGISAAFKQEAMKANQDLHNFGKTGDTVFNSFKKNSKQALLDFGSGSKTAGEAAKEFMFGSIADTAEAKGEELMLSSIWPPNPLGLAAGAGLIALSGALRSQAGGGSSGFGGIGAGGAGAGGQAADTPIGSDSSKPQAQQNPAQAMTVNFQGPVFDTDATRTRLMELMRQAQDMQRFNLNQIGPA